MKSALIVYGGWEGHNPQGVSELFESMLKDEGWSVTRTPDINALTDDARLAECSLVVPIVTMADPPTRGFEPLLAAVERGVGIAGCHGGMCDAFRNSAEWQFLTGGQFVAHPGNDGLRHKVTITGHEHPITAGIPDFEVASEQYYMHVDPAIQVLAVSPFPHPEAPGPHSTNPPIEMPVVWTKTWGQGRVFYLSLGHSIDVLRQPEPNEIMRRGMLWAAVESLS